MQCEREKFFFGIRAWRVLPEKKARRNVFYLE
jgi:hypothetical protein